jgi:hypothetical protein
MNSDGLDPACKACECERSSVRKHGLTSLEKEMIAADQDGCAVCGRTTPSKKGWSVDHDRTCCPADKSCPECRRGILCQWCNTALGYAGDNPTTLRRLADYLELGTRLPLHLYEDSGSEVRSEVRIGVPRTETNRDGRTERFKT